jgi:hypothetical protein
LEYVEALPVAGVETAAGVTGSYLASGRYCRCRCKYTFSRGNTAHLLLSKSRRFRRSISRFLPFDN